MRKLLFVLVLLVAGFTGMAQDGSVDVGIGIGGSFYWGDVKSNKVGSSMKPVFNGFFRYNFNPRYGIRVGGGGGTVAADGTFNNLNWTFEKNFWEINTMFEFFFLEYIVGDKDFPVSPYIMGGVGLMGASYDSREVGSYSENFSTPTLPFGLGVSVYLLPKMSLAMEANFRKTLNDGFDDLENPHGFVANDSWHNNDWVNYVGVTLNYKLFSPRRPCHAYD